MGTILGNILAVIFIIVAALMGFVSLETSLVTFLIISYGSWLLITILNLLTSPPGSTEFSQLLNQEEREVYKRFHFYYWAPGLAEALSCMLNDFRLVGIIWAGLAFWSEYYLLGSFSVAYFFVIGGIVVKLSPILYVGRSAQSGNEFAISQLSLMQAVQIKRESYNSETIPNKGDITKHTGDKNPISKLQRIIQDWPDEQAEAAVRVVKCVLEGEDFEKYFSQLTVSQIKVVNEILEEIDNET